jgi:Mn-dependent DtxR family transcriptional regulator
MEKSSQESKREFKGIWIPKYIWEHENLSPLEKILFAEIDSFEGKNGCFASNSYLAKILKVSPGRISQMVSSLKEKGFISVKINYRVGTKEVSQRIIRIRKK